jgi:hypothetical protein
MKRLLLILLTIPNLVLADTYLCISDAAGGAQYDSNSKKYKSVGFKVGSKHILKTGDENRYYEFGKDTFTTRDGQVKYNNLFRQIGGGIAECDETGEELVCKLKDGYFRFNFAQLRYVTVSHSGYFVDRGLAQYATPYIEIGACSNI